MPAQSTIPRDVQIPVQFPSLPQGKLSLQILIFRSVRETFWHCSRISYNYFRIIDGKIPKIPIKLSIAYDTRRKKIPAAKIRVLPSHDIKDVKDLLKKSKPKIFVADKAYDANWLHKYCLENNIKAHIPIRKYGKSKHHILSARRKATKHFNLKTYHRRELAESGMSSTKRKYGSSVNSKSVRTIRTEIYARLACHNIFSFIKRLLGQSRISRGNRNVNKSSDLL